MKALTHLDAHGRPRMVDVSAKALSQRVAEAEGFIRLTPETLRLIEAGTMAKGQVLVTAELAGVQAGKQTASLIPLCHSLPLTGLIVDAQVVDGGVVVRSRVTCTDRTGVEMEALTAVSVALLTVYDMCKAVDKQMVIMNIRLTSKAKYPVGDCVPTGPEGEGDTC